MGVESRRSAALAIARMLRDHEVDDAETKLARRALLQTLRKSSDPTLRGFAAVAMGTAREPFGLADLQEVVDHGGHQEVKPFAAIALGFAARTRDDKKLRRFLAAELDKTKAKELSSALCIALGVAGAEDAREALLELLADTRVAATQRGAAAQGLGLLRSASPAVGPALEAIVKKEREPGARRGRRARPGDARPAQRDRRTRRAVEEVAFRHVARSALPRARPARPRRCDRGPARRAERSRASGRSCANSPLSASG